MTTTLIKLIQGLATDDRIYRPGEEVLWDSVEAARFVEAGIAKFIEVAPPPKDPEPIKENMVFAHERAETFKPKYTNKGKIR